MIGCAYDYTKKYHERSRQLSQTFPVKEIQKKEIARAECAFFGRRKHARESPRARGDGDDDNTIRELFRMINRNMI